MSTPEEILINTTLAGSREFVANATAEAGAVERLGVAGETAGRRLEGAAKRGFIMNQALFTMRRLTYYGTLGLLGLAAASLKWGWDFNSAMQQARVALSPISAEIGGVDERLRSLFNFTKYTPFQFKDITIAFRQMYFGMRTLGISADVVQQTLKSIVDSLSATGRTTPGALNRVAVALQHMAYQGVLTGQAVNQLNRDGIPATAILAKMFGLTGEQIHNIRAQGIPTLEFLKRMNLYIESQPGLHNAAYRQATHSVHGLWTTIKDDISQVSGAFQAGLFGRVQSGMVRFLKTIDAMTVSIQRSHGSITAMVMVLDRSLSPGSHGVLRIWVQLRDIFHDAWVIFTGLVSGFAKSSVVWATVYVSLVLLHGVLAFLAPQAHAIGAAFGILLPIWLVWISYLKLSALWTGINKLEEILFTKATKDLTFAQFLLAAAMGRYQLLAKASAAMTWLYAGAQQALLIVEREATIAAFALNVALYANPFVWIIALVVGLTAGLVILYFKWRWFHDLVNTTARFIWSHWYTIGLVFGPLIYVLGLVVKRFQDIKRAAEAAGRAVNAYYNWADRQGHKIPAYGIFHAIARGITYPARALGIPGAAGGGNVLSGGLSWVGESGPEIMSLPRGATITPQNDIKPIFQQREGWMSKHDGRPIVIQLILDRRVLTEAVIGDVEAAGARA